MREDQLGVADTRLVFRTYGAVVYVAGFLIYLWPAWILPGTWGDQLRTGPDPLGIPWGNFAVVRIAATAMVALGLCALIMGGIKDPWMRRRALVQFGLVHLFAGMMFWVQWSAVLAQKLPEGAGISGISVGILLLFAALAPHDGNVRHPFNYLVTLFDHKQAPQIPAERLQSEYEEQIARAARQEERARLARDLHDAVKQQLFVIQTAAATAQARFDGDAAGAKTALGQVRASAREAITEMEAMLAQLQAPPLANAGLVDALRREAEALGFRTGATVTFAADPLPPEWTLPPGAAETLFRIGQEAMSNVARHARAATVKVSLTVLSGRVTLVVHDDGSGFDPDTTIRGVGTTSMRKRLEAIDGEFELWSRPGGGTTVRAIVPFETASAEELRTMTLRWGAAAIASGILLGVHDVDDNFWGLHACITGTLAGSTATYAVAWLRLRRRERRNA